MDTFIAAPPDRSLEAVRSVTLGEMRLAALLLAARTLPTLVTRSRPRGDRSRPAWEVILRSPGFVDLADAAGGEMAFGYVGRPWTPSGGGRRLAGVDEFLGFDEPGYAKVAAGFSATAEGSGSRLSTETRIHLTDSHARRAFAAYWLVVRHGSRAVRVSWLRAARKRALTASRAA